MATLIDRGRLQELVRGGAQLVEVLPPEEYAEDHLPGAISIPLSHITQATARGLELSRAVIVYCWDLA